MAATFRMMIALLFFTPALAAGLASNTAKTMRREQSQVLMTSSGKVVESKVHSNIRTSSEAEAELRADLRQRLVKDAEADAKAEAEFKAEADRVYVVVDSKPEAESEAKAEAEAARMQRMAEAKRQASESKDKFVDNDMDTTWDSEGLDKDFCDDDFPLGKEMTNQCLEDHHRILASGHLTEDMGDCRQAAAQAGINVTQDFEVPYDYYRFHPIGCFVVNCTKPLFVNPNTEAAVALMNPLGKCYFYNPSPANPDQISSGTPVCKRPKLINGTVDTNGGCPDKYEPIVSEAKCAEFAECLGRCTGSDFRINLKNASKYDEFPKYCFIRHHEYDNCVYFNEPRPGMIDPTHPVGMPLCNVSEITHFPAMQGF